MRKAVVGQIEILGQYLRGWQTLRGSGLASPVAAHSAKVHFY